MAIKVNARIGTSLRCLSRFCNVSRLFCNEGQFAGVLCRKFVSARVRKRRDGCGAAIQRVRYMFSAEAEDVGMANSPKNVPGPVAAPSRLVGVQNG